MKLSTVYRILSDSCREGTSKEKYWRWRAKVERWLRLPRRSNRHLAVVALREHVQHCLGSVSRSAEGIDVHVRAAVDWLGRAQDATPDDGVSAGYFPCERNGGNRWLPSYPETTGYIIPTLLEYARSHDAAEMRERALRMAIWETEIQMENGAVQAGLFCPREKQQPAVFNTGMVLQGYVAAMQVSADERIARGARGAADFLVADQGEDGHFRAHGPNVRDEKIKTYNCLCAWPLYLYGEIVGDARYVRAATRAVEAAVREQQASGWFAHNCLTRSSAPLLHTIGYTLQGILEVGALTSREDLMEAVKRGVDPVLATMSPDGFLHGRYYSDWEPASFSACLTGSAQIAVVCYRMFELTGEEYYRVSGQRILGFLKSLQVLDSPCEGMRGALAGSYPLMSEYQSAGYPNWGVKYLVDGLMAEERLSRAAHRAGDKSAAV